MREARPHRSGMDPDAHFDGVTGATILPNERLPSRGPDGHAGGLARNAFHEPDHFIVGSHGDVGGNDPMNTTDDSDWD